ncbi:hypothetical protein SH661x_001817 [Planctomicrobium sp. SH661]|uniref:hypothetical protein n=1 Tax=Planctomicrobium sp. SH661 TaxID=3448124 RepID=UPI003F5BD0E8
MEPQTIIDDLTKRGMEFAIRFVPYSQAEPQPGADGKRWECFNWRARITFNGRAIATNYRTGTAHVTKFPTVRFPSGKIDKWESGNRLRQMLESGRGARIPTVLDVLASLVSDAFAVLDVADFEEFAREFGYSVDSRSAERTYRECVRIGLKLRAMFGADLATMREAFADL